MTIKRRIEKGLSDFRKRLPAVAACYMSPHEKKRRPLGQRFNV
jgi:hypothetical protein